MDFKLNPTGSKHGAHPLLGERLKDWIAQLLKALSSGSGVGEEKLKWRKSLFNPPHPNRLPLEKEQSYLCPPSSGCAPNHEQYRYKKIGLTS